MSYSEKVMKNFSVSDQTKVHQSGNLLAKNGAKYNHNVDNEIILYAGQGKSKAIAQNKDISR